ncbi:Peptidyl-prolyl cis-trans isomerase [Operophtera brumata]|uniref:peptidylprolyl isomerase n=1 Tax=Operophtera brumata TaxID=104452 RepID=A0A0L7LRS1_OPEBR|nr:Peptidyl-prolyl cis-trans isomerase [Operophtera brumata]
MDMGPKIVLDEGFDLSQVQTTGSVLHINEICEEIEGTEPGETDNNFVDLIGESVRDFNKLAKKTTTIDSNGFVKKLILEEGGGMPIDEDCTIYVAFSAYWENENEPFDEVDLKDVGILPGLAMALKTMLVGELSLFLFSHEVMYGEMGIPPRIRAAAQCVFYIKLLKSILTPKQGSGAVLYKSMNLPLAANLFNKAVTMLHKCRLADEAEEKIQEKLLKKLYLNLAVCYNKLRVPLKACIACNELNRLNNLWNNSKALFQNAKALRMIGQYGSAEKRLRRAIKLSPQSKDIKAELIVLISTRDACNQTKLTEILGSGRETINEKFKEEIDNLIENFKTNVNLCKLTLPPGLNSDEMNYVREACFRANLFFNKIPRSLALGNNDESTTKSSTESTTSASRTNSEENLDYSFVMDKEEQQSSCDPESLLFGQTE